MAETNDLSGKVGLDTTDFKTNVAGMNRELRVLESGFRASAAGLGDWAKDASGLELRIKSLSEQMDIQKQKVSATRAEYERIRAEKGENSRAAQDLEIKLNKETETLGKMESELRETDGALEEMKTGTQEAGDAAEVTGGQVATMGTIIGGLQAIIGAAVAIVLAMAAAVVAVTLAIGGLVFASASAAADLVDMSIKTGISTTRLQELEYAGHQAGFSLDTVTGANQKLIKSMDTASQQAADYEQAVADAAEAGKPIEEIQLGESAAAFEILGVQVTDASGALRDSETVFNEAIDALGEIENTTERDALAMQLFGKSAQELNPLIAIGSEGLAEFAEEAHQVGAVISEEDVAALEAFDDTMASMKDGVKGLMGTLASAFLPVFQTVFGTLRQVLINAAPAIKQLGETLKKYLERPETQAFILKLTNAIIKFVQDVIAWIPKAIAFLQGIPDWAEKNKGPLLAALAAIAVGLAAFVYTVIIPAVVAWVAAMAPVAIATITALAPVLAIMAVVAAAVYLLYQAWTQNWGGIQEKTAAIWAWLEPIFTAIKTWFSVNITAAIATLSAFWTNTLLPAIQNVWSWMSTVLFPFFQSIADLIGAVFVLAVTALSVVWETVLWPALKKVGDWMEKTLKPVLQTVAEFFKDKFSKSVEDALPIVTRLSDFFKGAFTKALEAITKIIEGVTTAVQNLTTALSGVEVPAALTPGSPTPFETGLRGIYDALTEINQLGMRTFGNLSLTPAFGGAGAGQSVDNSQSVVNNINLWGVSIRKDVGRDVSVGDILDRFNKS